MILDPPPSHLGVVILGPIPFIVAPGQRGVGYDDRFGWCHRNAFASIIEDRRLYLLKLVGQNDAGSVLGREGIPQDLVSRGKVPQFVGVLTGEGRTIKDVPLKALFQHCRSNPLWHIPRPKKGSPSERHGRQPVLVVVRVHLTGNADLLQIAEAPYAFGPLLRLRHGRQQEARQNRNDRDDHQQLDQGEAPGQAYVGIRFHPFDGTN